MESHKQKEIDVSTVLVLFAFNRRYDVVGCRVTDFELA